MASIFALSLALFSAGRISADLVADDLHPCDNSSACFLGQSALDCARTLEAPAVALTKQGEFEGADFWEEHDILLTCAWSEVSRLQRSLFTFDRAFEQKYLTPALREGAAAARRGEGEGKLWQLFYEASPSTPGVWASDGLFTNAFLEDMLQELDHLAVQGIPTRRPNGMNRYGVILNDVGFQAMFTSLVEGYVRPLAAMLFPDIVGSGDAEEHYAFTVRYRPEEDVELTKHRDASVTTLNLCLGRSGYKGGRLRFFGDGRSLGNHLAKWRVPEGSLPHDDSTPGEVEFTPGMAVFHRGQHQHEALELTSGERTNLIVWLFARHGVVRVAPYAAEERLTEQQRWL